MGKGDFTKIPNGMPAIEDGNCFTPRGQSRAMGLERFVAAASTRAAHVTIPA